MSELAPQLLIDGGHPWPGLMPFTEDAQAFFHGRDQEATEFLRLIKRETLTVLFGQSGLGKSSLLNAGIFPRLRADDYLPIYIRLDVSEAAPPFAAQVKSAISANCLAHQVDAPEPPPAATLWGWLHHRDTDFWSTRNRLLTPVFVFDQFEEIFTLGRHGEVLEARCQAFLEELADVVEDRMPASLAAAIEGDPALGDGLDYSKHAWKVVFSFREDYLPEFEGLRNLIRPIMQNRMRLTRMSGEQARQSIAKAGGHLVRDEVAEQIVRFVAAPRGGRESSELARLEVEPALMSVVCRELNNRRLLVAAREISADLLSAGAQHEIIHDYYEDCLSDIDARVRCFVEDKLLTDAGYRDSAALEDALLLPGVRRDAIDLLIGRRLLRLEERSGVLRVELTHDVLTRVAKESRDNRKEAERLRLQREAEQARRRRTRRLTLIVGSSLTLAIGLAVVFAVLLGRANEQRERLLVTQSSVMLSRANSALEQGVPGEPYAMLGEAIRLNPENRSALTRAVALFAQRRQPLKLASWRLAGGADIGWLRGPAGARRRTDAAVAGRQRTRSLCQPQFHAAPFRRDRAPASGQAAATGRHAARAGAQPQPAMACGGERRRATDAGAGRRLVHPPTGGRRRYRSGQRRKPRGLRLRFRPDLCPRPRSGRARRRQRRSTAHRARQVSGAAQPGGGADGDRARTIGATLRPG
ncbi:MAG: repeat protein [Proteobacteria bacterium]|nr:repeat protein [Pseudomonadota bacterium]